MATSSEVLLVQHNYSHRSKLHLADLAAELNKLPLYAKGQLVVYALALGLVQKPFTIRVAVWFLKCRHGSKRGPWLIAEKMSEKLPKETVEAWKILMDHMLTGKSKSDPSSAGAWSHQELGYFLKLAKAAGWQSEHVA